MEIIREGTDRIFDGGGPIPLGCCFPVGTEGARRL